MADAADLANDVMETATQARVKRVANAYEGKVGRPDCEDCGVDIPLARREGAPWAATCIECQTIREMKGKHRRVA
jgi:phage/conjugal plasmid C-4 type zinc finger TraR family protein